MISEAKPEKSAKPGRFHFRLTSLIWLQLLVTPLFLSPFYRSLNGTSRFHPYATLIAVLLAPGIYVTLLTLWPARRQDSRSRQSVFVQLRCGALYGLLFCVLAFGPLAVMSIIELVMAPDVAKAFQLISFSAFFLLHYAIIGSVVGGGVAIIKDLVSWHGRGAQPQRQPGTSKT